MSHRPVCVKCKVEMLPDKNETICVDMVDVNGELRPYQIWESDRWRCPVCGHRILTGFGAEPIAEHYEGGFDETLERVRRDPNTVESRQVKGSQEVELIKRDYKASIGVLWDSASVASLNAREVARGQEEITEKDIEDNMGKMLFEIMKDIVEGRKEFDFEFSIIEKEVPDEGTDIPHDGERS